MKRWIVFGLLVSVTGCHSHDVPTRTLSVFEARTEIKPGMTKDNVVALMGKPWRSEAGAEQHPGILGAKMNYDRLFWHEGNKVARVDLTNDQVTSVQLRDFPKWAMLDFGPFGSTMNEVRQRIGPPSRSAKQTVLGKKRTVWVYTDKTGSEKTMVIGFDQRGQVTDGMCGPNRSDYDDIVSN